MNSGYQKNDPQRVEKGWTMVKRNVDRVRAMVLDILYYAKDREPDLQCVSVSDIVSDISETMENKARELGVEFIAECSPDVGEFEADAKAIRSMLANILENSLDACRIDKKPEKHRVVFGMRRSNQHMHFEIDDNGIGMDRETQEKIFSLFFSSKAAEGTGLGLFISNKIAQQHGGRIDVDSRAGVGTHFTIHLPLEKPASTDQS